MFDFVCPRQRLRGYAIIAAIVDDHSKYSDIEQTKRVALNVVRSPMTMTGFAQKSFRVQQYGLVLLEKSTTLRFFSFLFCCPRPHQVYAPLRPLVGKRHRYSSVKRSVRVQRRPTFQDPRFEEPANDDEQQDQACVCTIDIKKKTHTEEKNSFAFQALFRSLSCAFGATSGSLFAHS